MRPARWIDKEYKRKALQYGHAKPEESLRRWRYKDYLYKAPQPHVHLTPSFSLVRIRRPQDPRACMLGETEVSPPRLIQGDKKFQCTDLLFNEYSLHAEFMITLFIKTAKHSGRQERASTIMNSGSDYSRYILPSMG